MPRLLVLAALLALVGCGADAERPNIVLVIADDQAWNDFGFMGSAYARTPNIDRLAAEGTLFTHGFNTASVCRPSLRTLLTGLHPHQWRHRAIELRNRGIVAPDAELIRHFATLPRILAERGYASFEGGKFWEADHLSAGFTHGMQAPGDDPSWGGQGRYLGREPMTPLYDFIDENRASPFFIWFAPMLPHYPHDPPRSIVSTFDDTSVSPTARLYYANIVRLDDLVGELLERLDATGLRERTLVVLLADNGWDQTPDHLRAGIEDGPRGKKTIYEIGFRTPIILHWPGRIRGGERRGELVSTVDVFPTLLDYAGASAPPDRPGHSLRPLLEGGAAWPRKSVIGRASGVRLPPGLIGAGADPPKLSRSASFVRTARWRYVWYEDADAEELYEIENDPRESRDVSAQHPRLVRSFRRQVVGWRQEMARPFQGGREARAPDTR